MEAVEVTFDDAVVMIAINDAVELWREKMPGDDDGTKYNFNIENLWRILFTNE